MSKILVVDDDNDIAELEKLILEQEGFEVIIKNDAETALDSINTCKYDLILMDIMMPNMSGIELCNKVREKVDCSIIFVTAKSNLVDKMVGFEIGADDYVTKPFEAEELVSRCKAHIRKDKRNNNKNKGNILKIGEIEINKECFEVKKNNSKIDLSTREFELLKYLMENAGIVLSKDQIFDSVWGHNYGEIGAVAVHIKNLRTKLDKEEKYIITVWGYGYKFVRFPE